MAKKNINDVTLLLKAYYETLYERLDANRENMKAVIEKLLREEIAKGIIGESDKDKFAAYRDACLAFVDERLEMYNPVGIQYTFDRTRAKEAFELGLQLDWYDSRAESEQLTAAAKEKAEYGMSDSRMRQIAAELIKERGGYPDRSIISAYQAQPKPGKLPDYITARAIEEVIR